MSPDLWTWLLCGVLVFRGLRLLPHRGCRCHLCPCKGLEQSASADRSEARGPQAVEGPEPAGPLEEPAFGREDAAASVECQTLMGRLADSASHAQIRSGPNALQDVDMPLFLEAARAYHEALSTMGMAVNLVLGDFEKNFNVVEVCVRADSANRKTFRSFLLAELDAGIHSPGLGDACRLRDPSGACSLQWLLRGFEFFFTMLKLVFGGDQNGASNAYAQTLQQFHGWTTSLGIRAALSAMPGRSGICGLGALCPALRSDPKRLSAAIARDVDRAVEAMLPMVLWMIAKFKELHLWESFKV